MNVTNRHTAHINTNKYTNFTHNYKNTNKLPFRGRSSRFARFGGLRQLTTVDDSLRFQFIGKTGREVRREQIVLPPGTSTQ
jgi:hypothetical protein